MNPIVGNRPVVEQGHSQARPAEFGIENYLSY